MSRLIYKAYESKGKLYISNEPQSWLKLITEHPTEYKIYKSPFWHISSRSYLAWVANYPFLLHVETQTNPIYEGTSMTNLSTNGVVRQQWKHTQVDVFLFAGLQRWFRCCSKFGGFVLPGQRDFSRILRFVMFLFILALWSLHTGERES